MFETVAFLRGVTKVFVVSVKTEGLEETFHNYVRRSDIYHINDYGAKVI
jgi:hypothetical protein